MSQHNKYYGPTSSVEFFIKLAIVGFFFVVGWTAIVILWTLFWTFLPFLFVFVLLVVLIDKFG